MATIYHLALPEYWEAAQSSGSYDQSTLGLTLADEGFVHCSTASQWPIVRQAFYGAIDGPLLLLEVDEELLGSPVVREVGNPESGEEFPHVYGPINTDAVVRVTELSPPHA
jgi:uncharacterized protein (DUF952 family)